MNPKDLLTQDTVAKKHAFLSKMGTKLQELSGLKEAKSFEDLATRTIDRGLSLLPIAYLGVAASSYATSSLTGQSQELTQMIGNAVTVTSAAIGGLGTFLDIMGATVNKIREDEEEIVSSGTSPSFQISKSKVIGRMVAMSDNDPDPRAVNKARLK